MSENVKNISDDELDALIKQSDIPVLVDFWAPWCGPCKNLAPILEEIGNIYKDKLLIVKVNVDENKNFIQLYNIKSIPTLLMFSNSLMTKHHSGSITKQKLIEFIG